MHFKLGKIAVRLWLTAALLVTPAQAAPLLPTASYTGIGDVTNTSLYGGTIGIDDDRGQEACGVEARQETVGCIAGRVHETAL